MSVVCVSFVTLLISYVLIVCKLRRQKRKMTVKPMKEENTAVQVPSISLQTSSMVQK